MIHEILHCTTLVSLHHDKETTFTLSNCYFCDMPVQKACKQTPVYMYKAKPGNGSGNSEPAI